LRHLFVGDDTGVIKKVKMTFSIEQDVISVPDKPRRDKRKRSFEDLLALDDSKLKA
jgi:hypothetical protein